jgi:Rieske 2Fe-2S family protein
MDEVPAFEKAAHSLHKAALEVWEGFLFVNLAENPQPLGAVFSPLAEKLKPWNLPILRSAKRIEYEVRANWKLIFQNYSECYHCPLVHPALAKLSPYDAAENDLSEGPLLGGFMPLHKSSLTMTGDACAAPLGDFSGDDRRRVYYYSLFPNLLLSIHPDYILTYQIWPCSPDRSKIVCDWLFHPAAFGRSDFRPDEAVAFWDLTNRQDLHVCELSQQGIGSRAYRPGPYSPRESLAAAWDREYLRALGE